jgi:hypothetical protein
MYKEVQWKPGDVAWVSIVNGIENRGAAGKERPGVVVKAPQTGCLTVVGLSHKGKTRGGHARVKLRGDRSWGLRGRHFVYSPRPSKVARHDIFERLGRISDEDGSGCVPRSASGPSTSAGCAKAHRTTRERGGMSCSRFGVTLI